MERFIVRVKSSCDSNDRYEVFDSEEHKHIGDFYDENYARFIVNLLNKGLR